MAWFLGLKSQSPLILILILIEALLITAVLALFAYEYPQGTREQLWEEGGINGFNSNPKLRIYFYANHREPPKIAFIWSQTFTEFNLAVGIITFWIFVTYTMLRLVGVMGKWTHLFLKFYVLVFWILSLVAQQSSDHTDEQHLSRTPWYLSRSCAVAREQHRAACHVAQASFSMTVLIVFYTSCIIGSITYEILKLLSTRRRREEWRKDVSPSYTCLAVNKEYSIGEDLILENKTPLLYEIDPV